MASFPILPPLQARSIPPSKKDVIRLPLVTLSFIISFHFKQGYQTTPESHLLKEKNRHKGGKNKKSGRFIATENHAQSVSQHIAKTKNLIDLKQQKIMLNA